MKILAALMAILLGFGWFSLPPETPEPIDTRELTEFLCYSFDEHQEERWLIDVDGIDNLFPGDTSPITFIVKGLCTTDSAQISLHWPHSSIAVFSGDTLLTHNFTVDDSIVLNYDVYLPDSGRYYFYLYVKSPLISFDDTLSSLSKYVYIIIEGDSVLADTTLGDSSKVASYYSYREEVDLDTITWSTTGDATIEGYVFFVDDEENTIPCPGMRVCMFSVNIVGRGVYFYTYTSEEGHYSRSVESGLEYDVKAWQDNYAATTNGGKTYIGLVETPIITGGTYTADPIFCDPPQEAALLEKCYYGRKFSINELTYTPSKKANVKWPANKNVWNGTNIKITQSRGFAWTVAHEYGHFLDDKMYGPNPINGRMNNSAYTIFHHDHRPSSVKPPAFALSEGWAEFFEDATHFIYDGTVGNIRTMERFYHLDTLPYWRDGIYDEKYNELADPENPHSCQHGDSVEGAIAQFFWDLWDDASADEYRDYDDENLSDNGSKMKTIFINDRPHSITDFKTDWDNDNNDDIDELYKVVIHAQGGSSRYPVPKPSNFKPSYDFANEELDLSWTYNSSPSNRGRFEIHYTPMEHETHAPDFFAAPNATSLTIDEPLSNPELRKWHLYAVTADTSKGDTFLYAQKEYNIGFEDGETRPYEDSPWSGNPHNVSNVTAQRTSSQKYEGSDSYKFSGTDYTSENSWAFYYLYSIWSPIFEPTLAEELSNNAHHNYLSAYFKAVSSPDDSLHVSFDGILDPWARLERIWDDDFGWVVDQYGQRMRTDYHKLPLGEWKRYVFNLAPAHTNMLKNISIAYTDGVGPETGDFEAYVDKLQFSSSYPDENEWYVEVFGGDKNARVTWQEDDNQVDLIVDGNGLADGEQAGWVGSTIYHHPCIRKDILATTPPPIYILIDDDDVLSWEQYDKDHALILSLLVVSSSELNGTPVTFKWLSYAANAPWHWWRQGFVDMGEDQTCYNEWEPFTRNVVDDYNAEFDPDVTSLYLKALRLGHFAKREWDGDHGGSVRWISLVDGGEGDDDDIPSLDELTVIIPNGGERWEIGTTHSICWEMSEYNPDVEGFWVQYCTDYGDENTWENITYFSYIYHEGGVCAFYDWDILHSTLKCNTVVCDFEGCFEIQALSGPVV